MGLDMEKCEFLLTQRHFLLSVQIQYSYEVCVSDGCIVYDEHPVYHPFRACLASEVDADIGILSKRINLGTE